MAFGCIQQIMNPNHAPLSALALLLAATVSGAVPVAAASAPNKPTCGGQTVTILGTPGRDRLRGTPGPDVIAGLGGDDVIRGLGGDDILCGGEGADRILGGSGNDTLLAGRARVVSDRSGTNYVPDRLAGGPGDDTMDIGREPADIGADGVSGEIRFPRATGGVQVDLAAGYATGEGADTIVARAGLRVVGTPFADVLRGSNFPEVLLGQAGADLIEGRGGDDHLEGDPLEPVPGTGEGQDDVVAGGRGRDVVTGRQGADRLLGGPGLDIVQSLGVATHQMYGGAGNDFLQAVASSAPGVVIDGGAGRDDLWVEVPPEVTGADRRLLIDLRDRTFRLGDGASGSVAKVERFSMGADVPLTFYGTSADEAVYASTKGALQAWTYGGDDVVHGSRRRDYIDAGDGVDVVRGDGGRDTCAGAEDVRGCEETASP